MLKLLAPLATGLSSAWLLLWASHTSPLGGGVYWSFGLAGVPVWVVHAALGLLLALVTIDSLVPRRRATSRRSR